mmetsp:Transcript_27770/g.50451  ORF Transcript_27770/g.50451 Transcript_27770/m.50451 type:complete len:300 (+) Transcript_27770:148-1047(+)
MPSLEYIILGYVCPSLGIVMASATFAAPIQALRQAIARGSLGDLNPLPWAFMTGNCLGWVAYSFLKNDLFVFFANAPSLVLSIWLNMGAVKLQYREQFQSWQQATETVVADSSLMLSCHQQNEESNNTSREREQFNNDGLHADFAVVVNPTQSSFSSHEKWVLYIVTVWIIVLSSVGLTTSMSRDQQTQMIGLVVNANLIFFYAGPLATVATVFREGSSSTLHIPTVGMTVANTSFWMAYGFVIFDPYIIIPNGIGFVLGLIQLSLCLLFPRHKSDAPEMQLISGHDENEEYRDEPVIT